MNFNRPYVRNKGKGFCPIYMPGERSSFYINISEIPASDVNAINLFIIDPRTNTQIVEIAGLSKLFVAGSVGYHVYMPNFVFPLIPDGQYCFQVWSGAGKEICRSNVIEVNSRVLNTTSLVEFRHDDSIYNYRYDLLPTSFYNRFRLPINEVKAIEPKSTREQYRQSSGQRELRNAKSFRDLNITLEMYWANEEDFKALSAMLEHSDVRINGVRLILLDQVKVELPSDFSNQYKGTFTVIEKTDEPSNYKSNYIARGGTNNYLYQNFLRGRV